MRKILASLDISRWNHLELWTHLNHTTHVLSEFHLHVHLNGNLPKICNLPPCDIMSNLDVGQKVTMLHFNSLKLLQLHHIKAFFSTCVLCSQMTAQAVPHKHRRHTYRMWQHYRSVGEMKHIEARYENKIPTQSYCAHFILRLFFHITCAVLA